MDFADSPYVQDLLAQPDAVADTLAGLAVSPALEALAARPFERIVLTGMGGSFHALHALALKLIAGGRAPVMVETSELVHHMTPLLDERALVVAVSQSGRSAEIVRLAGRCAAPILAVTNTPDSPLAKAADAVVLTRAGAEFSVSCKTYVATLAALEWLGGVLCGESATPRQPAAAMRAYLDGWQEHAGYFERLLDGANHLFLTGRGASLAAVGTGGLILKEAAHFPAEGMSSAAFRHGPLEMLRGDVFVLVFRGAEPTTGLNAKLAADIVQAGGRAALVGGEEPALHVAPHPVLEILPAQMISLALAARAGHRPGEFTRAAKITETE